MHSLAVRTTPDALLFIYLFILGEGIGDFSVKFYKRSRRVQI